MLSRVEQVSLCKVPRVNRYELYHVKTDLSFCISKPKSPQILTKLSRGTLVNGARGKLSGRKWKNQKGAWSKKGEKGAIKISKKE